MTDRDLLQQALDALSRSDCLGWQVNIPIIKALRARLTQQDQEPVTASEALRYAAKVVQLYDDACMNDDYMIDANDCENILNALAEYYEAGHAVPLPREWQGLTERELMECITQAKCFDTVKMTYESGPYEIDRPTPKAFEFARAIEAKLKDKNAWTRTKFASSNTSKQPTRRCLLAASNGCGSGTFVFNVTAEKRPSDLENGFVKRREKNEQPVD